MKNVYCLKISPVIVLLLAFSSECRLFTYMFSRLINLPSGDFAEIMYFSRLLRLILNSFAFVVSKLSVRVELTESLQIRKRNSQPWIISISLHEFPRDRRTKKM